MEKSIHELKNMPSDSPFESILKVVEETMPIGYITSFCRDFKPQGLFRARSHNRLEGNWDSEKNELTIFSDESHFWNVPEDKKNIIKINRCNLEKESVFYCSNDLDTAILEARPEKEKYISVALFGPKNNEFFSGSRVNFIGKSYLSKIPEIDRITNFSKEFENEGFNEIDDFLDSLFHKNIGDNEKYLYKQSVAVTKCLMSGLINEKKEIFPIHGLVYSSIIRDKKTFNVVYEPSHVRMNYQIICIQTFKVIEDIENTFYLRRMGLGTTSNKVKESDHLLIDWLRKEEDGLRSVHKHAIHS